MSDEQEQIPRDFRAREEDEQQDLLTYTWCNHCQAADLGMKEPVEYELLNRVFIDGVCLVCDQKITTEVISEDDDD